MSKFQKCSVLRDTRMMRERWGINLSLNSFRVRLREMDCTDRTDLMTPSHEHLKHVGGSHRNDSITADSVIITHNGG